MISDQIISRQVSDLMLDVFQRIDESLALVRRTCPPEEAAAYQKATGRIVGPIVMDVLEPLYRQHPELSPPNWNEPETFSTK
jgi:hypothetical protein